MEYPNERVKYMMEDSEATLTIDEAVVREAVACGLGGELRTACPENLAYMIYTSGSTGKPKGVMIQHISQYQQEIIHSISNMNMIIKNDVNGGKEVRELLKSKIQTGTRKA